MIDSRLTSFGNTWNVDNYRGGENIRNQQDQNNVDRDLKITRDSQI